VYNSDAGTGTLTATGSAGSASSGDVSASGASAGGTTSGAAPATPERGATNDASGTATPTTATSCAVSTPGSASNRGFVLLALGMFGIIRRRRAARA
jgi:MYXO-CTERM domain-containing protein